MGRLADILQKAKELLARTLSRKQEATPFADEVVGKGGEEDTAQPVPRPPLEVPESKSIETPDLPEAPGESAPPASDKSAMELPQERTEPAVRSPSIPNPQDGPSGLPGLPDSEPKDVSAKTLPNVPEPAILPKSPMEVPTAHDEPASQPPELPGTQAEPQVQVVRHVPGIPGMASAPAAPEPSLDLGLQGPSGQKWEPGLPNSPQDAGEPLPDIPPSSRAWRAGPGGIAEQPVPVRSRDMPKGRFSVTATQTPTGTPVSRSESEGHADRQPGTVEIPEEVPDKAPQSGMNPVPTATRPRRPRGPEPPEDAEGTPDGTRPADQGGRGGQEGNQELVRIGERIAELLREVVSKLEAIEQKSDSSTSTWG